MSWFNVHPRTCVAQSNPTPRCSNKAKTSISELHFTAEKKTHISLVRVYRQNVVSCGRTHCQYHALYVTCSKWQTLMMVRSQCCQNASSCFVGSEWNHYVWYAIGILVGQHRDRHKHRRHPHQLEMLTLYVLNFSERTKACIYVLCHSSTLTWCLKPLLK